MKRSTSSHPRHVSRRRFLAGTVAATAGAAVLSRAPAVLGQQVATDRRQDALPLRRAGVDHLDVVGPWQHRQLAAISGRYRGLVIALAQRAITRCCIASTAQVRHSSCVQPASLTRRCQLSGPLMINVK